MSKAKSIDAVQDNLRSERYHRLELQLERAINDALGYLDSYTPEDLVSTINDIENELNTVEDWEEEDAFPGYERSYIECIRFLGPLFESLVFSTKVEDNKRNTELSAIFALFRAVEGKHALKKPGGIAEASQACCDAYEALYQGLSSVDQVKKLISDQTKTIRAIKAKQGVVDNKNYSRSKVVKELKKIINCNADVLELIQHLEDEHAEEIIPKTYHYKIKKKNGSWHIEYIANYIYDKMVLVPQQLNERVGLEISLKTVRETVSLYLDRSAKLDEILNQVVGQDRLADLKTSIPYGTVTPPKK